jgi:hypothetical protein
LLHKSDGKELTPKDAKTKAEEADGSSLQSIPRFSTDTPEIGAAWLAGARFDVAISELKRGKVFPKYGKGSPEAQAIVHQHDHREL